MMERIKRAVGIKAPPSPVPPDPNYTYNVWMLNGYCQKNSEFQDVNVVRYYNASIDPVQPNSICPVSILDTRYMLANGNGTAGVSSFNGRIGAVVLLDADITNALGYTPANPANLTFAGLSDVTITNPKESDTPQFDATQSKWVNIPQTSITDGGNF